MLYNHLLSQLTEEQIAILYIIADNALLPMNIKPNYNFLKYLRADITIQHVEFLKNHAKEEFRPIFDDLKTKISDLNK